MFKHQIRYICDVICENLPYDGTYIVYVGPGQTPHEKRGVLSRPTIFVANKHLQRTGITDTGISFLVPLCREAIRSALN